MDTLIKFLTDFFCVCESYAIMKKARGIENFYQRILLWKVRNLECEIQQYLDVDGIRYNRVS